MSPPVLRLCALLLVVAVLAYGLRGHQVAAFTAGESRDLPGLALREAPAASPWWPSSFVEGATVEAFIRRGDGLFNVYSLQSGEASLKDCKT